MNHKPKEAKPQPMQPIYTTDTGHRRFQPNAIVDHLLDCASAGRKCDMNDLACMPFSQEDRQQFAQLIGYSLGGYSELSYVSDESYRAACKVAEDPELDPVQAELAACKDLLHTVRVGMRYALGELYGKHPDDFIEVDETDEEDL